ncbi:potassium channel family protein [Halalkalicoccus jeotgali]|uniref:TrkA-N domain protein n=1 Tax=Halalkalicoccus jeotgali (strain DSM 18796 / CECT 7217 / JCM 14584 / KCTC 4019 / B3) TaxID=795797 RepID=D8J9E4_HALJB|nr:NAD(P)-binding protein [Halalkalicoccus jeotgali]ADJ14356.1 TrkA-N domain protein [Halalkalicoccus jeotgali B3]
MTRSDVVALTNRPLLRRAVVPLAAFGGVVVAGVVGFVVLGGVGAVEATFWLADPTSIELHFAGEEGGSETATKAYALGVTVGLVVTGLWVGETVLSAAFGGQVQEELRRMQTDRAIDDARDHVIICGYGTFGRTIADRLDGNGEGVVVIERDEAEFEGALAEDVLVLQGDARREETLREAGIEHARTLVTAIDDSNANIQTAITAGQIAPTVRLVVRVGDAMYEPLARRAGADEVVIPEVVSGERVTESL